MINNLPLLELPSPKLLSPTSQQYELILFNAKGLQAKFHCYDEVIPLDNPMIYVSSRDDELPIVIDTGASCSITPDPLDFDDDPVTPEFSHLSGISPKTAVNGQGNVTWVIED